MINYVLAIVVVALIFDFINGFHDSANSIATVVGTRVLRPLTAVMWAAFFNFVALWVFGTAVAKTIGKGMIDVSVVTPNVILGGLIGAIIWNLITWWYGLPSSSSHALIGGYAGAAVASAGAGALLWGNAWILTLSFIVLSPLIGMLLGYTLMVAVFWVFHTVSPARVDRFFRAAQLISSAMFSLSHGANDAQKTMGIVMGLLVSTQTLFARETGWLRHLHLQTADFVPYWLRVAAHLAIALGTLLGGWRIVRTMGTRITKLRPVGGFCAETGGAVSIFLATGLGIPVSTTHTITGSIVGVGATTRLSAVRWGVATRIVWAWILTIPMAAAIGAVSVLVLNSFVKL